MSKSKKNLKKIKHLCYDGVGARGDGKHTVTQFLKIMNKKSKISWKNTGYPISLCAEYKKSFKCTACKKQKRIWKYMRNKSSKNPNYIAKDKYIKKHDTLFNKCTKCSTNTKEICDLNDFIKWSGANIGKCK